jgi:hypothetical protein
MDISLHLKKYLAIKNVIAIYDMMISLYHVTIRQFHKKWKHREKGIVFHILCL